MSEVDTSAETVELFIQRCWLTDPMPDRTETMLRALLAERDGLRAQLTQADAEISRTWMAAYARGRAMTLEKCIDIARLAYTGDSDGRDIAIAIEALKEATQDKRGDGE